MNVADLLLLFLACGAVTFPLTLSALYVVRSLWRPGSDRAKGFENALTFSLIVWIAGALIFYGFAVLLERRKPCLDQHTNQLTAFCKKDLGSSEP